MSPFIVTTKRPQGSYDSVSEPGRVRRAVATLESQGALPEQVGVKELLYDAVIGSNRPEVCPRLSLSTDECLRFNVQIEALTESGGSIGPLPDGTTIQVEPMSWVDILCTLGRTNLSANSKDEILAAYNAKQATG